MDTSSWTRLLIEAFPNLSGEDFEILAQPSRRYNCIPYAAVDTTQLWWPNGISYWPPWATVDNKIESLKELFAGLEYEQCQYSNAESGYQKVALYEIQGKFQHAALQMPNRPWRSKMGQGPVIEHRSPESLSGEKYGHPVVYMRRGVNETRLT